MSRPRSIQIANAIAIRNFYIHRPEQYLYINFVNFELFKFKSIYKGKDLAKTTGKGASGEVGGMFTVNGTNWVAQ
jgi:hypothetical protein